MTANFEKDSLKRLTEATIGLVALTIGSLIYVRYRSESLLMFNWFQSLGLSEIVEDIRRNSSNSNLYGWVKYNMPAALWLFAYMFIIDSVWGREKNNLSLYFLYALPLLALASELM